jgi:hypothetical protein
VNGGRHFAPPSCAGRLPRRCATSAAAMRRGCWRKPPIAGRGASERQQKLCEMLDAATRFHLSDDLLRRLGAVLRGVQLYSRDHPIVSRNMEALAEALRALHQHDASIIIGILGDELIVGDLPMSKASASMRELIRRLKALGIERITITREVTLDDLKTFVAKFGQLENHRARPRRNRYRHDSTHVRRSGFGRE